MLKVMAAPPPTPGLGDQALQEAHEPLWQAAFQALYIRHVLRLEPVMQEPYIRAPIAAGPLHC